MEISTVFKNVYGEIMEINTILKGHWNFYSRYKYRKCECNLCICHKRLKKNM